MFNKKVEIACEQAHLLENWRKDKKRRGGGGRGERKGKSACRDGIQSGVFCIPFQYAEILAIPLVEKCEVGGQRIFERNSFQITVRRDAKKAIAEI